MAKKVIKNITIDQGATFSETVSVTTDGSTVKNLTGYTTTSQFRKSYDSTTYTSFTTAQVDATGVITLSLTAAQTSALKSGRYVYDVLLKHEVGSGSTIHPLISGNILVVNPISSAP